MKKMMKYAMLLLAACSLTFAANAQDIITTVVGGGPNNIPGVNANLSSPYETAVDAAGNVYVASSQQNRVFKIDTSGVITVLAGTGVGGYNGDGQAATAAELYTPWGVAVDTASPANVYIGDYNNCLVRKVSGSTGKISTIAGLVIVPTSGNPYASCGYSGNGGAANAAQLNGPAGLAINASNGDVYFADYDNGVVRKIAGGSPTGTLSLVAGSGGTASGSNCGGSSPYGDGAAATAAYLCYPQAVSLDTSASPANVFISEYDRCDMREVVGSSAKIYQVAGSYTLGCGFTDNVIATSGQLNDPWQSHVSVSGSTTTVQVADYSNARIRQFTLTYSSGVPKPGTITTIGGKGSGGFCNDNGPVLNACMNPVGLAYDSSGNYYIGDYGADRVRKVTKSTTNISTIAGWGPNGGTQTSYSDPVGISGDGGTPSLYYPYSVWADPKSSKVYVGGYDGQAVYVWDSSSNEISDEAGSGVGGFTGDGTTANTSAVDLSSPLGIGKDSSGNVYIADQSNCAIREVSASTGDITTVVGGSSGSLKGCGFSGDGGPAINAQLNEPQDVVFDSSNNMYITDYYNCAIRKVNGSTQVISTIVGGPAVGCGYSGDGGLASAAQIRNPESITLDGEGNIYFTDQANYRIRKVTALTGVITTVAGDGAGGYTGDGPAIGNELNYAQGVSSDVNGNLFIADTNNQIARWVTPTGTMITIGGTVPGSAISSAGFSGDGGNALKAQMYQPSSISVDSGGNYYIADEYNFRIRKISAFAGFGLSTNSIQFNTQQVNSTSSFQPVTVSAVGPITISSVSAPSGFSEVDDCAGQSLTAGQTCEIDVYFSPTSTGNYNGTLHVSGNTHFAANPTNVYLSGTGGGLRLSASENFYTQLANSTTSKTVSLENTGAAVKISKIYWTSTTHFTITGGTCPVSGGTLAAGSSCTLITQFKPLTAGGFKSTLVVDSNDPASPLLTQGLGNGTDVELSTSAINFGTITHGTNTTSNLTITNVGTTSFTLSPAVTGTGFSLPSAGKTCGSSLAGGASCVLPVEFAPTAAGNYSGSVKITTNGGSNPSVTLTGTAN